MYVTACNKASVAAAGPEVSEYSLPRVSLHGSRLELPSTTHISLNAVLDQHCTLGFGRILPRLTLPYPTRRRHARGEIRKLSIV